MPGSASSISTSVVPAGVRAAPIATGRNAAYDRARTFIILLVLLHHSVIPYTYYGHTDRQSFMGFDAMVIFNDSYFMSAMFFLSGAVRLAEPEAQGNWLVPARPLLAARPSLHRVRGDLDAACLLRGRTAPAS